MATKNLSKRGTAGDRKQPHDRTAGFHPCLMRFIAKIRGRKTTTDRRGVVPLQFAKVHNKLPMSSKRTILSKQKYEASPGKPTDCHNPHLQPMASHMSRESAITQQDGRFREMRRCPTQDGRLREERRCPTTRALPPSFPPSILASRPLSLAPCGVLLLLLV